MESPGQISAGRNETLRIMKTFTLTPDLKVTAYSSHSAAVDTGDGTFRSADELDSLLQTVAIKPVELWNSLPGVKPVNKFMDRKTGIGRIWKQLQSLGTVPEPVETAHAAPQTPRVPRDGSKLGQVAELLKRPAGATLEEIMQATGWQRHTVRGFIAGAAKKKLGLTIESSKSDGQRRCSWVLSGQKPRGFEIDANGDSTWAGFGPKGPQRDMFEWLRAHWK